MVVEELVSKWGFDVDWATLEKLDKKVAEVKRSIASKTGGKLGGGPAGPGAAANNIGNQDGFSKLGGILGGVGAMAVRATYSLAAMSAPLLGFFKVAGGFEQTEIAFETMIGDADKAHQTLDDLQKFAKETPFNFSQVAELSKQLLAVSFQAEELIPTMRTLGDISAGVGMDKLPHLTYALSQVKTLGHLNGRDLLQFTMAGVPLVDELAKSLGKTKEEVQGLVTGGQVTFDMVFKALQNMTGAGGRFFNLMEKQSHSLMGIFSNIVDTVGIMIVRLSKLGLLDRAKNYLQNILNYMESNQTKILGILNDIIETLVSGISHIINFGQNVFAFLAAVSRALGGPKQAVERLFQVISILTGAKLLLAMGQFTQVLFGIGKAFLFGAESAAAMELSALAIPLAIGAALLAIGYLIEDIYFYTSGKGKSLIGSLLGDKDGLDASLSKLFKPLEDGALSIGKKIGKAIVDGLAYLSDDKNQEQIIGFISKAFEVFLRVSALPVQLGILIAEGIMEGLTIGLQKTMPRLAAFFGLAAPVPDENGVYKAPNDAIDDVKDFFHILMNNPTDLLPKGAVNAPGSGLDKVPFPGYFKPDAGAVTMQPTINFNMMPNMPIDKAVGAVRSGVKSVMDDLLTNTHAAYKKK